MTTKAEAMKRISELLEEAADAAEAKIQEAKEIADQAEITFYPLYGLREALTGEFGEYADRSYFRWARSDLSC